jgi:hypothetical protein
MMSSLVLRILLDTGCPLLALRKHALCKIHVVACTVRYGILPRPSSTGMGAPSKGAPIPRLTDQTAIPVSVTVSVCLPFTSLHVIL